MTASTGCSTQGTENRAIRANAALPLTLNYADTARASCTATDPDGELITDLFMPPSPSA